MPQCPNPQLHVECNDGTWLRDDGRYGEYLSRHFLDLVSRHDGDKRAIKTGCKLPTCYACHQNRALNWGLKGYFESLLHDDSSFITFTYADKHLPTNAQLRYDDVTLAIKRLRRHVEYRKGSGYSPRYLYSGEYGDRYGRPHYHMALFGYRPDDLIFVGKAKNGDDRFTSATLTKLWGKGHVEVGQVTMASILYICNYIIGASADLEQLLSHDYKLIVPGSQDLDLTVLVDMLIQHNKTEDLERDRKVVDLISGELIDRVPPTVRASNRPGLGRGWFDKYGDDCLKGTIRIQGRSVPIPRNFRDLINEQFKATPGLRERFQGEPETLATIDMPDHNEQLRLMEYNRTVQVQKRIGAISNF
jgi:hypothetical protein